MFIKGSGHSHSLEGGAGLRGVGYSSVSSVGGREFTGPVGIEIRPVGHRQYFSGRRPDHHGGDTLRLITLHRLIQFRLHDVLHTEVYGKAGIQPIAGGDVLMAQGNHLSLARIGFGYAPTSRTGEAGIQHGLDALLAVVICAAHKTKHMGSQPIAGVHAKLILLAVSKNGPAYTGQHLALFAGEARFVHSQIEGLQIRRNFLPFFPWHFPFENHITVGAHLAGIGLK